MKPLHFEQFSPVEQRRLAYEGNPDEKFITCQRPLKYSYWFPDESNLRASQDESGVGHIEIKKDMAVIFDMASLLPEGFRFVTPVYFEKHPDEDRINYYVGTAWQTDTRNKLILLGEFQHPQDLVGLLHEIGHANCDTSEDLAKQENLEEKIQQAKKAKDKTLWVLYTEEHAKLISDNERRAWAYALHALKKIEDKTGTKLKPRFSTFGDIENYINGELASYRRQYEWIIKEKYDESFYRELQKMFDKWQYEK